jgi:hypothetical protein
MDADWKSFIVAEVVKRTLGLAKRECGGCKDGNHCSLLHACQTTSLLRKLECFLDSPIKVAVRQDLESILNQFEFRFILLDRRENYIEMGETLLNDLNPQSLYYGRFITQYNDVSICGPCFKPFILPPRATQELKNSRPNTPFDESAVRKQLREECDDYDNLEEASSEPPKKKQKAGKTKNSTNNKKPKFKKVEVL